MSSQTPSAHDHDATDTDAAALSHLREETERLVAGLPGPLRRVVVRTAAGSVEVEWGEAAPTAPAPAGAETTAATLAEAEGQPGHHPVVAPLVGTFYRAPEPGAAPFVEEGQVVGPDDTVGIVEAMKLMNEVSAGRAGRISRIVAEDGDMVEFAQVLMYIDESEQPSDS